MRNGFPLRCATLGLALTALACGPVPGAVPRQVPGQFAADTQIFVGTYMVCTVAAGTPSCFAVDSKHGAYSETHTRKGKALDFLPKVKGEAGRALFAFSGGFGCAVDQAGKLTCFEGSMGGTLKPARKAPFIDSEFGDPVAVVAAGDVFGAYGCVANAEQKLDCFSDSLDATPRSSPEELRAIQLSAGPKHACATTPSGQGFCWGQNDFGQLGHKGYEKAPVAMLSDLAEVVAGGDHSCARDKAGKVSCFGRNQYGQLGVGELSEENPTPRPVALAGKATQLALGDDHSCALLESGKVQCWGRNAGGVLGDGSDSDAALPTEMLHVSGVVRIAAGAYQTCALQKAGTIVCYGMSEVQSFRIDLNDLVR